MGTATRGLVDARSPAAEDRDGGVVHGGSRCGVDGVNGPGCLLQIAWALARMDVGSRGSGCTAWPVPGLKEPLVATR